MPIEGKFYQHQELQILLEISKQAISNLAYRQGWSGPQPGLYWAEPVEDYLVGSRNIAPETIPIKSYEYPHGVTLAEREADYDKVYKKEQML